MAHAKEDENFGSEREAEKYQQRINSFMAMDEPSEGQCKAISRTRLFRAWSCIQRTRHPINRIDILYKRRSFRSCNTVCWSFAVFVHAYNNQMHWYMYHRAKYVPDQGRIGAEPRMCQSHFPGKQPLSTPLLPFLGSLGSAT